MKRTFANALRKAHRMLNHGSRNGSAAPMEKMLDPVDCSTVQDIIVALNQRGAGTQFLVPVDKLAMHGAYRYSSGWHPFTAALKTGPSVLHEFYTGFRPKNLAEMYFIDDFVGGDIGEHAPQWSLPWAAIDSTFAPIGEHGLGIEHGVSYFGPASPQKVALEYSRLTGVLASIQENGYEPCKHGNITGWFLQWGEDFRFFVRGGKHRTAALAVLGYDKVPVQVRDPSMPIVSFEENSHWTAVRNETLSLPLAQKVFSKYFEFDGSQQWKKIQNNLKWNKTHVQSS